MCKPYGALQLIKARHERDQMAKTIQIRAQIRRKTHNRARANAWNGVRNTPVFCRKCNRDPAPVLILYRYKMNEREICTRSSAWLDLFLLPAITTPGTENEQRRPPQCGRKRGSVKGTKNNADQIRNQLADTDQKSNATTPQIEPYTGHEPQTMK